jgi:hypothetical protein
VELILRSTSFDSTRIGQQSFGVQIVKALKEKVGRGEMEMGYFGLIYSIHRWLDITMRYWFFNFKWMDPG